MSSAEPRSYSESRPGVLPRGTFCPPSQSRLPGYLPVKTPLSTVLDLYPAVSGKVFSDILLPGKGKKPRSCEGWSPTFFCPSCGKPHFTKGNCHGSTCPDCEVDWRFDRCRSIMERILSMKIQRSMRCRHFVVSPYLGDYPETLEELKELRREVYDFARSKGVEGAVVLFHPLRILPEVKEELRETVSLAWIHRLAIADKRGYFYGGGEFKFWRLLLRRSWSEILKCVYYAPHFHILAVGEKGDRSFGEAEKSDRFVWKGVSELSSAESLGKCTMYLLSHVGVFQGNRSHSIVWFGSLSTCNWSLDRATMRLRNGSTVKEFVLDLVADFIGEKHEELSGRLECDNCGHGLIHISSAPDYFEKVTEFREELEVAYDWWSGVKPPPEPLESEKDCWDWVRAEAFVEPGVLSDLSAMVKYGRSPFDCEVERLDRLEEVIKDE